MQSEDIFSFYYKANGTLLTDYQKDFSILTIFHRAVFVHEYLCVCVSSKNQEIFCDFMYRYHVDVLSHICISDLQ